MENKELKFKTNLNCANCVSKVQATLDSTEGIAEWKVDTEDVDKILTVSSQGITKDQVLEIVKSKGFKIEPISA